MKKILTSTLVLAAAALTVSTVVNAAPKYEGTYVGQMAAQDARVQAAKGTPQYDAIFDQVAAEIEASMNKETYGSNLPEASSFAEESKKDVENYFNDLKKNAEANGDKDYTPTSSYNPETGAGYYNHKGSNPKSGPVVNKDASGSSSSSSETKSSASSENGSKETKSTEVAVKEAKKAAKAAAKEGQKVLPNTAAVK